MDFLPPDEAIEILAGHGGAGVTLACDSPLLPDKGARNNYSSTEHN